MALLLLLLGLGLVVGLALLCGFLANVLFPKRSPKWRAVIAGVVTGIVASTPLCFALVADGANFAQLVPMITAVVLLAALSYPVAIVVTRRRPGPVDPRTFD